MWLYNSLQSNNIGNFVKKNFGAIQQHSGLSTTPVEPHCNVALQLSANQQHWSFEKKSISSSKKPIF
jgi:hypothetical protein